jgi:hypothetical protein
MFSSNCNCKGPCLPHCYSKTNNYFLFFMIGIVLGMILYHIIVKYCYNTNEKDKCACKDKYKYI